MKRQEGIAIVAAVKNRTEPLRYSLATWIDTPAKQIILVDWCSDTPLIESLESMDVYDYPDPRIVHVRVEDEPYWNPCAAWNLAVRFVTQNKMLKLDADVCVSQKWMLSLGAKQLRTVDWDGARSQNEAFLTGSWFGHTSDFIAAGGYDERLEKSYGYEDDNLYGRMVSVAGVTRKQFENGTLLHLPHSQKSRFENYEVNDTDTEASELLHHSLEDWTLEQAIAEGSKFDIEKIEHNLYQVRRQSPSNV